MKLKSFKQFLNEFEIKGSHYHENPAKIIHTSFMNWNGWGNYNFKIDNDEFQTLGYGDDDNEVDEINIYSSIGRDTPIITYTLDINKKDIEYKINNQEEVIKLIDYLNNRKYLESEND